MQACIIERGTDSGHGDLQCIGVRVHTYTQETRQSSCVSLALEVRDLRVRFSEHCDAVFESPPLHSGLRVLAQQVA